jgi:hypothetical protein
MNVKNCLSVLALVIFLSLYKVHGQFVNLWDVKYAHSSGLINGYSNESKKIAVDANGNIFVLADVVSDTDPNGILTGLTYHYTVLLKYDSNGNLLNQVIINVNNHLNAGFTNYGAFGLEIDAAQNVYIGYASYSAVSDYDVVVSKYTNSLTLIWSSTHPSVRLDQGVAMAINNSGQVYLIIKTTNLQGNITYHALRFSGAPAVSNILYSFETATEVIHSMKYDGGTSLYVVGYKLVNGFKAALTAKISTNGMLLWKKIFDAGTASRDDYLNDLVIGSDGNVYAIGFADRGLPTNNDAMVLKHDAGGGKVLWAKYIDRNNGNENGVKIISPIPNFIYIGVNSGNSVFIEKLDNAGLAYSGPGSANQTINNRYVYNPVPVSAYQSLNGASFTDIQATSNNRFYLTGNILATDNSNKPFNATFLIRLKETPNSRSSNIFSLEASEAVNGSNNQAFVSVGLALYSPTKNVFWLRDQISTYSSHEDEKVRIDAYQLPSPFRNLQPDEMFVSVTPNPVIDKVTISSSSEVSLIRLYDLSGRECDLKTTRATGSIEMDMTGLNKGVYILKVFGTNENVYTHKLIKN